MNYRGTIAYRSGVGGMVYEGFCASLLGAWDFLLRNYQPNKPVGYEAQGAGDRLEDFNFMRGQSCMLHDAANRIAEGFLGDWVLFLDTDHIFGADAFLEMVQTFEDEKLDILTGFTQQRQPPYRPLLSRTDFDPMKSFIPIVPKGLDRHQLISIDSAGLACLMVRRNVFDAMDACGEKPFDMRRKFNALHLVTKQRIASTWQGVPVDRHKDECFWEDVSFFWRAKMLGIPAYCAPWIKFHHIETRLVDETLIQDAIKLDPRIPV